MGKSIWYLILSHFQVDYDGSDYGPPKPKTGKFIDIDPCIYIYESSILMFLPFKLFTESGKPIPEFRVYENGKALEGRPCLLFQMEAAIIIEPNRQVNRVSNAYTINRFNCDHLIDVSVLFRKQRWICPFPLNPKGSAVVVPMRVSNCPGVRSTSAGISWR